MSALDLSSLLTLSAPEMLAPADPPATPEIDTSATSTSDSSSSTFGDAAGSSTFTFGDDVGDAADRTQLGLSSEPSAQQQVEAGLVGAKLTTWVNPYDSANEEAAAAVVDLSGASSIMVDEYEVSVPPNLAAASALLAEVTSNNNVSAAAMGSLYTLMNSSATLALTAH
jgi:hypothetical protein